MEDIRNKGEEGVHQGCEVAALRVTPLLKLSQISALSTVLLLPGAADTTHRLAGLPRDNATAVPVPREQGPRQAHTHWAAFQDTCLSHPGHCQHAYRQEGALPWLTMPPWKRMEIKCQ